MNLTNHFLIAMPQIADQYFKGCVIYICQHNEEGAMGLIINMPLEINIKHVLKQIDVQPKYPYIHESNLEKSIYNGGPVSEDRGFILHRPKDQYEASIAISEQVLITTSKDILTVLGTEAEPTDYLVALGYSGWKTGQLEEELNSNSWLTAVADPDIIFNTPPHLRWQKAIESLGIDVTQLSSVAGHA